MRTLITFGLLLSSFAASAQTSFGDITGTIYNKEDKEGVFDATVYTISGDAIYRAVTDPDGRFRISAIPPGRYELSYIYQGDTIAIARPADVSPDGIVSLDTIYYNSTTLGGYTLVYDPNQLRLTGGVLPEIKLAGKEYRMSPNKFNPKAMVISMTPDVKMNDDGELVFRGARAGDVICYLDGVKMNDVPRVPSSAIGYMMVYSGAIPAKYGDTNGGVVVIETLSYTDLWRDWKARTKAAGQ